MPVDPNELAWDDVTDPSRFRSAQWTDHLTNDLSVFDAQGRFDPDRQKLIARLLAKNSRHVLKRLRSLQKLLEEQFVGKVEIIKMLFVCAIAQQPLLLVGPPGGGKSLMIHRFCEGLGIARMGAKGAQQKFFEYLLHGFTEPDEILGVVDLHELKENKRFTRIRDGSITEADLIFLDEAFRGNSAILNSLLTIINERRVYEAGEIVRAKARVIFGASNDTPTPRQLEELGAFYSRFIIRLHSPHTAMEFVADGPSEERVELLRRG